MPDDFHNIYHPLERKSLMFCELIGAWIKKVDTVPIWVMQEYGVRSSWNKTFVLSMHPVLSFHPICFTNCSHIVRTGERLAMEKFNDKGELLEHHFHSYAAELENRGHHGHEKENINFKTGMLVRVTIWNNS